MEIVLQYFDGCLGWSMAADRLAILQSERKFHACRMYATPGGFEGAPALEDLRAAIARAGSDN